MSRFYCLEKYRRDIGVATTDFLDVDPVRLGDAPKCEACGDYVGSLRWLPPLRAELETWGTRFGDLSFGSTDVLVSERFKILWAREQLSGLHGFEPVEIVKVRFRGKRISELPPKYFRVYAERSLVAVDQARCGIEWMRPPTCDVCRTGVKRRQERIVLDGEPTSNVFIARGQPGSILVDERFKRFVEEHAVTNCSLIPIENARFP